MLLNLVLLLAGLALLTWSADRFIAAAASLVRHWGVSPMLIGIFVLGVGTSAPEIAVSIAASLRGAPDIALGNAVGSNITNIALILGITALISPISVHSQVMRKELPILATVTALAAWQVWDGELTFVDALVLLGVFLLLLAWSIRQGMTQKNDALGTEVAEEMSHRSMPLRNAVLWLIAGLLLLIVSSRILVWGAVELALGFGVSDLIIGLTIVAVGTSLPELASSVIAARKGEHDIALGNILGSNLFNTLAVVGIAGTISPMVVAPEVFYRDIAVMAALTLSLFILGYGFRGPGRINRLEGGLLLACFVSYTVYLISTTFSS